MSKKLWEWGGQKRKPCVCAINAQSGTSLQIVSPAPSPYNAVNGNSSNSRQTLALSNWSTNANYVWARSCGNREATNARTAFVQSPQQAVRACKLFLLHHRRIMPSMEIRANSRETLARNNSCTNANYIWARSCGNREAKNANTALVQSTHKVIRAWKLFLLHHHHIVAAKEIRVNSRQNLPLNNSCTNANYIWASSCGNGGGGGGGAKTQTLRLCNQRTKR